MIRAAITRWCRKRMDWPADFVIGDGYLYRWYLYPRRRKGETRVAFRLRRDRGWFRVYLHLICRDDDDRALHDHPWANVSYVLDGSYREVLLSGERLRDRGSLIFRRATTPHRLAVIDGPVMTLFITGPRVRDWGFWCPQGWRNWRVFTDPSNTGRVGRGCE